MNYVVRSESVDCNVADCAGGQAAQLSFSELCSGGRGGGGAARAVAVEQFRLAAPATTADASGSARAEAGEKGCGSQGRTTVVPEMTNCDSTANKPLITTNAPRSRPQAFRDLALP